MKAILLNLALRDLIQFCQDAGISANGDGEGSNVQKIGRGFTYGLFGDVTGKLIATVTFHKNQVPTHTFVPVA